MLCACFTALIYMILPGVLERISSVEATHANALFAWIKSVTPQLLKHSQAHSTHLQSNVPFVACFVGLFAAYLCMLRIAGRDNSAKMQRFIFWSGALFLAINLMAPVMLSTDCYAYSVYGRMISFYHLDAYSESIPVSLTTDKFYQLWAYGYVPSVYGPLWTLISTVPVRLGGENSALVLFLFRVISAGAILAGTGFIGGILRKISPDRVSLGMALFLWNPLVIVESAMSGHNDTMMVAFLLLGVWLHVKRYKTGAALAILLSSLVKFVTGPLLLLYVWMVLRQMESWRERAWFVARSLVCCAILTGAFFLAADATSGMPAARIAGSAEFYNNNFHELIFNGIRRFLGEDPQSIEVPLTFQAWWFKAAQSTKLYNAPSPSALVLGVEPKDRLLLVIAPLESEWAYVFDPVSRKRGYFLADFMAGIKDDSGGLDVQDPVLAHLEECHLDWPTVLKANLWIRRVCSLLFASFGLLAAWRTTNFERFLSWSAIVMLVTYYLIMTQFWPWYMIWALALGALNPGALPAKFAMWLSFTVLSLYVTIGYENSDFPWVFSCRSLFSIVLPSLIFFCWIFVGRKISRDRAQTPSCENDMEISSADLA